MDGLNNNNDLQNNENNTYTSGSGSGSPDPYGNNGAGQSGYRQNAGMSSPYQSYGQYVYGQQPPQSDALAIVGMVLGIISIPAGCCYGFGIIFAIAGLICSIIGIKKKNSGYAIAGILTSAIGFVISVLIIVIVAALVRSGVWQQMYWNIYREIYNNYDLFIP